MHKYIMEGIGTFFLVLVFGFTGNALAIGLMLSAFVYIGFNISGAHYNPAVSLAFFFKDKLSVTELFLYIASQITASILAAMAIYFFSTSVFYIEPPYDTTLYQQAGAEVFLTFIFVWVMLTFTLKSPQNNNHVYGFAIGLTFAGIVLTGTKVSGGVFNPAISLGPAIFDLVNGGGSISYSVLYTLAPLTGGALAAGAFTLFEK